MTETAELIAPEVRPQPAAEELNTLSADDAGQRSSPYHTYRNARTLDPCPVAVAERAKALLLEDFRNLWNDLCLEQRRIGRLMSEIEAIGRCLNAGRMDAGNLPFTVQDALDHFGPDFIVWMTLRKLRGDALHTCPLPERGGDGA